MKQQDMQKIDSRLVGVDSENARDILSQLDGVTHRELRDETSPKLALYRKLSKDGAMTVYQRIRQNKESDCV